MKVIKGDGQLERRIVTAMVVSKEYLDAINPSFKAEYIQADEARVVALWCMEYYGQYKTAPGKHIRDIFDAKRRAGLDGAPLDLLQKLLESLSDNYDPGQFNIQYLLDETEQFFNQRALMILGEDIQDMARGGELLEAETAVNQYKTTRRNSSRAINVTEPSATVVERAFAHALEPLVEYPGPLGYFLNNELVREGFVGIMAPEKTGKIWLLIDMAVRATHSGSNVVFFEAGDLTDNQLVRRLGVHLVGRSDQARHCKSRLVPVWDCYYNQVKGCKKSYRRGNGPVFGDMSPKELHKLTFSNIDDMRRDNEGYKPCHECAKKGEHFIGALWFAERNGVEPMVWQDAHKAMRTLHRRTLRHMTLLAYPNDTLRVENIEAELENITNREGWSPDVVIVDYADLLSGEGKDERDKQNRIWKRLRALSQERRCLVLTATQADAKSYDQTQLRRKNFSEDKRKYAHVTCMLGLHQVKEDKDKGVVRLNRLVVREDEFDEGRQVHILQCLSMGKPFLGSY